jgi:hypothetical protein
MKAFILTLALGLVSVGVFAQKDSVSTDQPEPGQPQGQYGTQRVPQPAGDLKEDRVEVESDQVPPAMLDELNANSTYAGWEEGNIFYEKNTDQYIIHVVRDNTTHTFRFDKEGNAIRTDAPVNSSGDRQ